MGFNLFLILSFLCIHQRNVVSASKEWIVAAQFDPAKVSPLCGLNCIKPIGADPRIPLLNRSVGLHRCTFSSRIWDLQLWTYNNSSNQITIPLWDTNHTSQETAIFCLENRNITSCNDQIKDVAEYPTKLANCTGAKSQEWYVQQDGRIRSGLLSDKGEVLYLQSQSLQTEPGGHAPLCVGPVNSRYTERQHFFTFVPFLGNGTLYSSLMARIPSTPSEENLVLNGGFEDTAPRRTEFAPAGNFTLFPGNPDLCYWSVGGYSTNSDGPSSVVVTSPLSNPGWSAQQGNNSLLMGGNGVVMDVSLTQLISTQVGTEYSLSFFMSGYPALCGNKTLKVQLSPSSNSSNFIADEMFSSQAAATVEWENFSLNFVARSEATNLTFLNSMRAGTCAPVIDNIVVVKPSKHRDKTAVAAIATVSCAVVMAVVVLISFLFLKSRRRKAEVRARLVVSSGREREIIKNGVRSGSGVVQIRTYAMWELREATENFSTKVGEGGFGIVYRANLGGNRIGAVKRATKRGILIPQVFKEELSVLLRLNHPNLVNLIGLCFEEGEQILVFEFVPKGNLNDRLHKPRGQYPQIPLPWSCRMSVALQIAKALQYLHEQAEPPVLHHDVKSSNVLLVDDNHAKLADFGLSKLGLTDNQALPAPVKGSYGYTDPQYIKTGKPSIKSDVYSFGVVFLELITGRKAVQDILTLAQWSEEYRLSSDLQVVMSIVDPSLQGNIDLGELNLAVSIVNCCLREEGEFRPAMGEIVRAMICKTPMRNSPAKPMVRNRDGDTYEMLHEAYSPSPSSYVADTCSSSVLYAGR